MPRTDGRGRGSGRPCAWPGWARCLPAIHPPVRGIDRGGSEPWPEIRRHIAKRRDTEALGRRLELRMLCHELMEMSREQDVVADHLQIAGASDLPERQPDLQRPEPPRILRAVVVIVH